CGAWQRLLRGRRSYSQPGPPGQGRCSGYPRGVPDPAPAPIVFERRPDPALVRRHQVAIAAHAVVVSVCLFASRDGWGRSAYEGLYLALGLSLGDLPVLMTFAALAVSPYATFLGLAWWRAQRFGRCEVAGDEVRFVFGKSEVKASRSEIADRWETPHGVVVRVRGRPLWLQWVRPCLVPAPEEEER